MKSEKPYISILTSTWNREFFLKKMANSLLSQTLKNFEWIVGNDGSDDNTDSFIKSFSKQVKFKIKYVNSSKRIGKAAMDNILLDHVSGEYLTWCDSDDIFLPETIEKVTRLIKEIPANKRDEYIGIYAQNVDKSGKSQTFRENNILNKTKHVSWEYIYEFIKGDGTIFERSEVLKGKKFLEVDFLISESSYFLELYKGKKFIFTPLVVKVMDRSAENSVSFGKKLSYSRGSAYCIAKIETLDRFNSYIFSKKLKIILNYWRYCIHGDIKFLKAKEMFAVTKSNWFYSLLYIFSFGICLIDIILGKVEKTHIEFNKNIKSSKVKITELN
tara:strand:+ start:344 stop:1330 length:987 start_codon:yes stop_codon:yes gene_type:complete